MTSVRSVGGSIIKRHVEARKDRSGRSVHRFHLLHPLDSGENLVFGGCCRFGWRIEGVVGDRECVWVMDGLVGIWCGLLYRFVSSLSHALMFVRGGAA